jgi:hypothetical protein
MAIASIGSIGSAGNASLQVGVGLLVNQPVSIDDVVLLSFVTENIDESDGPTSFHDEGICTNANMDLFTKLGEYTNSNGAAGDGVTASLWYLRPTAALVQGSTTIVGNCASAVVEKVISAWAFTVGDFLGAAAEDSLATDGAEGFGESTIAGLGSAERLYFRVLGKLVNSVTALTPTDGWSVITGQRSQNAASAVVVRGEFIIDTSEGAISDPTMAVTGDTASFMVALAEGHVAAGAPFYNYYHIL